MLWTRRKTLLHYFLGGSEPCLFQTHLVCPPRFPREPSSLVDMDCISGCQSNNDLLCFSCLIKFLRGTSLLNSTPGAFCYSARDSHASRKMVMALPKEPQDVATDIKRMPKLCLVGILPNIRTAICPCYIQIGDHLRSGWWTRFPTKPSIPRWCRAC